jgi:hypothetical protein
MSYTITQDSIQSSDYGYLYDEGEEVTVAAGVVVSSTENIGVFSPFANSRLINNGDIVSWDSSGKGIGVQFDQDDASATNAAGASITGFDSAVRFYGDRMVLINHGTISGLSYDGVLVAETAADWRPGQHRFDLRAASRDPVFRRLGSRRNP